ncbi:DUF6515 family protein [Porifericola rhodea]|uniref:DUF6515 family protein n=1 Tax=Porifericola rhodea TaxID=930972 RepID=UPI0026652CE8|nr:DUF6515 family protein [Porifericola rhodea]WKN33877.1 DUF6515 family protein [Porifericola rhodea]
MKKQRKYLQPIFTLFAIAALLFITENAEAQRRSSVRRHTVVKKAPKVSVKVNYNNVNYRVHNHVYYKPVNGRYIVVSPPVGIRVKVLPAKARRVVVKKHVYYYYEGSFYSPEAEEYVVVQPPVGALVEQLPEEYEHIEIDGQHYYIADGVQYKAILNEQEVWYEVIKVSKEAYS